ncbi:MAG: hypothetical protein C5B59_12580 [Bacteroidetes bacterium]|nr:MAG: hypothetical protein C5B59_12580 [Bacteroidota bacterium]
MKQNILRVFGMASFVLLAHFSGFAQSDNSKKDNDDLTPGRNRERDEIIIKRKNDKDSKVTIEIKGGQVLINGKPADEFQDDNLSVRKIRPDENDIFVGPRSPFRGGWSYNGDELADSKVAFLGVSSEKSDKGGAQVLEVTEGSAAEKIGLKKGDIITRIDDVKIDDPSTLTTTVRKHKPDDKIVITYVRDGKTQVATATLGKKEMVRSFDFKVPNMNGDEFKLMMPPHGPGAYNWNWNNNNSGPRLGIKAQDTEDGKGVKVLDIDDESAADKAGVKEGDIITQFDGKEVNSASQLAEMARAARTKPSVKLKLKRNGRLQDVEVKIPKKLNTAQL